MYKYTVEYEDMIDHCSYVHNLSSCEIKTWKKKKNSGLNRIRTHDLWDTGAVLYSVVLTSFSAVQIYDLSYIHLYSVES